MPTNVLHGQVLRENKLPQESWRGSFLYNFIYVFNKPGDPFIVKHYNYLVNIITYIFEWFKNSVISRTF